MLPPMPPYCEVALPVPLDRTFTYAVKQDQFPQRGARVIVPFGALGAAYTYSEREASSEKAPQHA